MKKGRKRVCQSMASRIVPAAIRAPERRRPSICSLFSLFSDVAAAMKQKTR